MSQGAASLRQVRIMHAIFLLAILLEFYNSEMMAGNGSGVSGTFVAVIVLAACFELLLAYFFRFRRLSPALEKLRRDPNDANALKQWRGAHIVILVLTMSVALYGFVLRVMGAGRRVAWPFFVLAFIIMLLWRPQLDLSADGSESQPR